MPVSLYEVSIPAFLRSLNALSGLLKAGVAHVGEGNESTLLESRLIADMAALPYQIQRISDTCKFVAVRVAKVDPVVMEDNEKTFPELQARIQKTIEFLEKVDPQSFEGTEENEVVANNMKFTVKEYILNFAIPNFYFHYTTAYALLRKEGVPIGKKNFMGAV